MCFDPIEDPADKAVGSFAANHAAAADDKVWWCQLGCGGNVHAACMRRWIGKSGQSPACPLCRAPWKPQEQGDKDTVNVTVAATAAVAATCALPSPERTPYVNLRRYQPGTTGGRDLGQYNEFAQRAIERREDERRRLSSGGTGQD